MKKTLMILCIFVLILTACVKIDSSEIYLSQDNIKKYTKFINKMLTITNDLVDSFHEIKFINTDVLQLYPIAVVNDNKFFIFDLDEKGESYEFKTAFHTNMNISKGILAAFPLEHYDSKIVAVVSPSAFDNLESRIVIFHEFVHCYQFNTVEMKIKNTLDISLEAVKNQDWMWELNHPFPYNDDLFKILLLTLGVVNKNSEVDNNIIKFHKEMKKQLTKIDFEYMIWQEWKEGYARLIENKIRVYYGLKPQVTQMNVANERIIFYGLGERYIERIISQHPEYFYDIEKLFYSMYNIEL